MSVIGRISAIFPSSFTKIVDEMGEFIEISIQSDVLSLKLTSEM